MHGHKGDGMAKLNQIIAIEKGEKTRTNEQINEAYKQVQKPAPFAGIARTYQPVDEDGETLPPESTRVQVRAQSIIDDTVRAWTDLMDITATKEIANCAAKADVTVDGTVIVKDAPVTFLLFLEKQLTDLHTFVSKLPVLSQEQEWHYDSAVDCYATVPVKTVRSKKVPRVLVAYEATKEHPAQVQVWQEDVKAGEWTKIEYSGALPQQRINQLLERVEALKKAVQFAREAANNIEVTQARVGKALFDHVFAK